MVLVDSNVILDILTDDPVWAPWSVAVVRKYSDTERLIINPIIYSEVSAGFQTIEELELALPAGLFDGLPLPWEAAFLAGKAFLAYKKREGGRRTPLPDFYIGAHAAVLKIPLMTRDASRYRTYFPRLILINP